MTSHRVAFQVVSSILLDSSCASASISSGVASPRCSSLSISCMAVWTPILCVSHASNPSSSDSRRPEESPAFLDHSSLLFQPAEESSTKELFRLGKVASFGDVDASNGVKKLKSQSSIHRFPRVSLTSIPNDSNLRSSASVLILPSNTFVSGSLISPGFLASTNGRILWTSFSASESILSYQHEQQLDHPPSLPFLVLLLLQSVELGFLLRRQLWLGLLHILAMLMLLGEIGAAARGGRLGRE